MKPTVQNPDFYAVGNDYAQAPISAFYDVGTSGENYQDGIYTKLADELVNGQFSADPWKDPNGFNKRTILINPSASYADDDYGQADVIFNVGATDDEEAHAASAKYGKNDQFIDPDEPKKA